MTDKNVTRKIDIFLLVIVVMVFAWSAIKPKEYLAWTAEVVPAVAVLLIVIVFYRKFRFTTLSTVIIAILSIITFIGGHYTYSEVPLFNWIKDEFHLERNHYDRFGHFMKGLSAIVVREILIRKTPLSKGPWLFGLVTCVTLAMAAVYEIIEWLSTKVYTGGKVAKDFLGMQGDKWDAQWDMSLALAGTLLTLLIFSKMHNKLLKNLIGEE